LNLIFVSLILISTSSLQPTGRRQKRTLAANPASGKAESHPDTEARAAVRAQRIFRPHDLLL
jgi:hypothetical protein